MPPSSSSSSSSFEVSLSSPSSADSAAATRQPASITELSILLFAPAVCFFLGALIMFFSFRIDGRQHGTATALSPVVLAAMQHLAAGLVTAAIAVELVPELLTARGNNRAILSLIVGFITGVMGMLLLDNMCSHNNDDADDDGESCGCGDASSTRGEEEDGLLSMSSANQQQQNDDAFAKAIVECRREGKRGRACRTCAEARLAAAIAAGEIEPPASPTSSTTSSIRSRRSLRIHAVFPTVMCAAVALDGFVDGSLIGMSGAILDLKAAILLSVSLTVEMSFLGATLGLALIPAKSSTRVALSTFSFASLAIPFGGTIASLLGSMVREHIEIKVGFLSFGTAALLFLVTEELLLDAHDDGRRHLPFWVDLLFFLGFLLSVVASIAV
ncbi:zinc transporter [Pseudoscourfieldia marina]